jgi:hypothetical protein
MPSLHLAGPEALRHIFAEFMHGLEWGAKLKQNTAHVRDSILCVSSDTSTIDQLYFASLLVQDASESQDVHVDR